MNQRALLIAGNAHPALAQRIAQLCGMTVVPASVEAFADGETSVRIQGKVAHCDVFIVQPTAPPVNERLMALALLADAARAAGARRITAVVPYFGYARQDSRKGPGEPRSAQMASRILEAAGIDCLVALELHAAALDSAFRMQLVHVEADSAALAAIRRWSIPNPAIVSPDAGGLKRAQRYASALGVPLAVVAKGRPRPDAAVALGVLGDVRARECVIVDDLASTGGTIAGAARALLAAGAAAVHAFFVHAVMAPGAFDKIKSAGVQRIASTDSVMHGHTAGMEIVEVAPEISRVLEALVQEA